MNIPAQIEAYISSQPEPKRSDLQALHRLILKVKPSCKLWFLDGRNEEGKIVANPNIGYGLHTINYADGKPETFIRLVSVQINPVFPSISWALMIKPT